MGIGNQDRLSDGHVCHGHITFLIVPGTLEVQPFPGLPPEIHGLGTPPPLLSLDPCSNVFFSNRPSMRSLYRCHFLFLEDFPFTGLTPTVLQIFPEIPLVSLTPF